MKSGRPGVFGSALRAFFGAFFGLMGVFVGIIVVVILLGLLALGGDSKPAKSHGRHKVLPDAHWEVSPLSHNSPLILQVDIQGLIGSEKMTAERIREQLVRAGQFGERVKAIFLNVDSGGGGVFASDEIYRLLQEYQERFDLPIYAYTEGLCASGAFYISCAADKIYAAPATIVGSVGVLANFVNISETLEKIGAKPLTLTQGKNKDPLNPLRPWKENEGDQAKKMMAYFYDLFVDVVTTNRAKITEEELVGTYGANVFDAPTAVELGFIDGVVPTRSHALHMLTQDLELDHYQVVQMETENWLEQLFQFKSLLDIQTKLPQGYLFLYQG